MYVNIFLKTFLGFQKEPLCLHRLDFNIFFVNDCHNINSKIKKFSLVKVFLLFFKFTFV